METVIAEPYLNFYAGIEPKQFIFRRQNLFRRLRGVSCNGKKDKQMTNTGKHRKSLENIIESLKSKKADHRDRFSFVQRTIAASSILSGRVSILLKIPPAFRTTKMRCCWSNVDETTRQAFRKLFLDEEKVKNWIHQKFKDDFSQEISSGVDTFFRKAYKNKVFDKKSAVKFITGSFKKEFLDQHGAGDIKAMLGCTKLVSNVGKQWQLAAKKSSNKQQHLPELSHLPTVGSCHGPNTFMPSFTAPAQPATLPSLLSSMSSEDFVEDLRAKVHYMKLVRQKICPPSKRAKDESGVFFDKVTGEPLDVREIINQEDRTCLIVWHRMLTLNQDTTTRNYLDLWNYTVTQLREASRLLLPPVSLPEMSAALPADAPAQLTQRRGFASEVLEASPNKRKRSCTSKKPSDDCMIDEAPPEGSHCSEASTTFGSVLSSDLSSEGVDDHDVKFLVFLTTRSHERLAELHAQILSRNCREHASDQNEPIEVQIN